MARPGFRNNRKFVRLVDLLGMPEPHVWGHLEMLWDSAYQDGDDYLGDAEDVERAAGWLKAGGEPGKLVRALSQAGGAGRPGFIDPDPDSPGHWRVHDLLENAPDFVKSRLRMRRMRQRKANELKDDLRREFPEHKRVNGNGKAVTQHSGESYVTVSDSQHRTAQNREEEPPLPPADAGGAKNGRKRVVAPWAVRASRPRGVSPEMLEAAVVRCLREIRQAPVEPSRCGTAAKLVIGLWRGLDRPDLGWFADRLVLVARAAQMSTDRLFARDIRAEGWAEGTDRTNDVATITRQQRWEDRLAAAERWAMQSARLNGDGVAYVKRKRWVLRGATVWEPLDPPRTIFEEYLDLLRHEIERALEGDDLTQALENLEDLALRSPTSESVTAVVAAGLRWTGAW